MPVEGWVPDESFALPSASVEDVTLLLADSGDLETAFFDTADARIVQVMATPAPASVTRQRRSLRQLQRSTAKPHQHTLSELLEEEEEASTDCIREATPTPTLMKHHQEPQLPKSGRSPSPRPDPTLPEASTPVPARAARTQRLEKQMNEEALDPADHEQTPRASRAVRRTRRSRTESTHVGIPSPERATRRGLVRQESRTTKHSSYPLIGEVVGRQEQVQVVQNQNQRQEARSIEPTETVTKSSSAARLPTSSARPLRASCVSPSSLQPPGITTDPLSPTAELRDRSESVREHSQERILLPRKHEAAKVGNSPTSDRASGHLRVPPEEENEHLQIQAGVGPETRESRSRSRTRSRSPTRVTDRGAGVPISKPLSVAKDSGAGLVCMKTIAGGSNGPGAPGEGAGTLTKVEGSSEIKRPPKVKSERRGNTGPVPRVAATSSYALTGADSNKQNPKAILPPAREAKAKRSGEATDGQPATKKAKGCAVEKPSVTVNSNVHHMPTDARDPPRDRSSVRSEADQDLHPAPDVPSSITSTAARLDKGPTDVLSCEAQATNSVATRPTNYNEGAAETVGKVEGNLAQTSPQEFPASAESGSQIQSSTESKESGVDDVQDFLTRYAKKYASTSGATEKPSSTVGRAGPPTTEIPTKHSRSDSRTKHANFTKTKAKASSSENVNEQPIQTDAAHKKKVHRSVAPKSKSKPKLRSITTNEGSADQLRPQVGQHETTSSRVELSLTSSSEGASSAQEIQPATSTSKNNARSKPPVALEVPEPCDAIPTARCDSSAVPILDSLEGEHLPLNGSGLTSLESTNTNASDSATTEAANGVPGCAHLSRYPPLEVEETQFLVSRNGQGGQLPTSFPKIIVESEREPSRDEGATAIVDNIESTQYLNIEPKNTVLQSTQTGKRICSRPVLDQSVMPLDRIAAQPLVNNGRQKQEAQPLAKPSRSQRPNKPSSTLAAVVVNKEVDLSLKKQPRADDMFERKKRDNYLQKGVDLSAHSSRRLQHQNGARGITAEQKITRHFLRMPESDPADYTSDGRIDPQAAKVQHQLPIAFSVSEGIGGRLESVSMSPELEVNHAFAVSSLSFNGIFRTNCDCLNAPYAQPGPQKAAYSSDARQGRDALAADDKSSGRTSKGIRSPSIAGDPANSSASSLGSAITERIVTFGQRLMDTFGYDLFSYSSSVVSSSMSEISPALSSVYPFTIYPISGLITYVN